eukprot:m.134654 g.134654  ORF g.134654 m.134654 type:complete len:1425 (+) comp15827_c0_seq2:79-4353(+)
MSVLKFFRGLDISGTSFKNDPFPPEVDRLLNVRWIKLNACDLDMLPSAVNRLPKLEYLSIKNNELLSIGPSVTLLTNLRSFRAANNALEHSDISPELYKLEDLSTLDLSSNSIDTMPDEMAEAAGLLVLDLSNNKLKDLSRVFLVKVTDVEYLDISSNQITSLPPQIRRLANLRTLILSRNPLTNTAASLRAVSSLEYLVRLELRQTERRVVTLPPEIAECVRLEEIDLAENNFTEFPEVLTLLPNLREINLSDNQITKLPRSVKELKQLRTLNISRNALRDIHALTELESLVRLFANGNEIAELPCDIHKLQHLEVLRLARNKIIVLPIALCSLKQLKELILDNNLLTALPVQLHNLPALSSSGTFSARHNPGNPHPPPKHLLTITQEHNQQQQGRHTPTALRAEVEASKEDDPETSDSACYGVNFKQQALRAAKAANRKSMSHQRGQLHVLGGPGLREALEEESEEEIEKPELHRAPSKVKMDLSQLKQAENILKGLADTSSSESLTINETPELVDSFQEGTSKEDGSKAAAAANKISAADVGAAPRKTKNWKHMIQNPVVDGKNIFGDDFHDFLGLKIWRIEDFSPVLVNSIDHGNFYEADCYIVLDASENEVQDIVHRVYFWIGAKASLDKQASAAINAVNLRAYLQVDELCHREEQDDESRQFSLLFGNKISYIEGGTESGFYATEEFIRPTRMYLLHGRISLMACAVPLQKKQLQSDNVYLIDEDEMKVMWLWIGNKTNLVLRQKACLFCEKAVSTSNMKVVTVYQGQETEEFLELFDEEDDSFINANDATVKALQAHQPIIKLHEMHMGDGYLELPQVVPAGRPIAPSMLSSNGVYILDHWSDMYIWIGRRSSRLVRAAAARVALELRNVLPRPDYFLLSTVTEGTEPQVFKSKFQGWDDVLKIDHRSKDLVHVEANVLRRALKSTLAPDQQRMLNVLPEQLTASPLAKLLGKDEFKQFASMKVDVAELFSGPPMVMSEEEASALENGWQDDLDSLDAFLLQGGQFKALEKIRVGHFYSKECYIYLCSQWRPVPGSTRKARRSAGTTGESEDDDLGDYDLDDAEQEEDGDAEEYEGEEELECVAYFWQGRDASKMAWLQFRFGGNLERIEALVQQKYHCQLRLQREYQHKESMQFMALFNREVVMHEGTYEEERADKTPRLFRIHEWKPTIFTKTVQERLSPALFSPTDCCILYVPFEGAEARGVVYVWQGAQASKSMLDVSKAIGNHVIWGANFSRQMVLQGNEPERFFLSALDISAMPNLDEVGPHIDAVRFFVCTNRQGHFRVADCSDWFCQDDLRDEDVAILDLGTNVSLWIGPYASDVLIKLSEASAQEYIRQLPPSRGLDINDLRIIIQGKEPFDFTAVFHGWSHHLQAAKELSKPLDFLGHVKGDNYQRQCYEDGRQATHEIVLAEDSQC